MPNRTARPAIIWNDTYNKTLLFGYPLDEAISYPMPREGSEEIQGSSGIEDAWDEGTDYYLEGAVRWIPINTGNTPEGVSQTGWDGNSGWRAFLEWAWEKNVIRFCPDQNDLGTYYNCYLVAPRSDKPELESNYTRKVFLVLRTSDGTVIVGY